MDSPTASVSEMGRRLSKASAVARISDGLPSSFLVWCLGYSHSAEACLLSFVPRHTGTPSKDHVGLLSASLGKPRDQHEQFANGRVLRAAQRSYFLCRKTPYHVEEFS